MKGCGREVAVKGFFYNSVGMDRVYNGQDMNEDKAPFYKEGVAYGQLAVTAGGGMAVKVDGGSRTGYAYINMHTIHNTTVLHLDISQAGGNLPRIDRVVLRNDETERKPSIYILEGDYCSDPQPPQLTNTDTVQEKCLAEIHVAAGAVEITQADIKDTRADPALCGFIASQFVDIDFSQFMLQFDSWFAKEKYAMEKEHAEFIEEYKDLVESFVGANQSEWSAWFESIKGQLGEDAAGRLLEMLDRLERDMDSRLGGTDISSIGDGTVTGATAALYEALGGLRLVTMTQAEYEALESYDANTLYITT